MYSNIFNYYPDYYKKSMQNVKALKFRFHHLFLYKLVHGVMCIKYKVPKHCDKNYALDILDFFESNRKSSTWCINYLL